MDIKLSPQSKNTRNSTESEKVKEVSIFFEDLTFPAAG